MVFFKVGFFLVSVLLLSFAVTIENWFSKILFMANIVIYCGKSSKRYKVIVNCYDISKGKPCYENGIYKSEAPSLLNDP